MDELKQRQKEVLRMIVSTHVKTAIPVGSRTIAKCYHDEVSPATIRNEMHDLEERDYILQPHTSAGRIPTDKGYRYYVDHLMQELQVPPHAATLIAREFRSRLDSLESLVEKTSKILSVLSEQAGLVTFPSFENLIFKRIELTSLGQSRLLVVWVTTNGFVQNRVTDMKEEIPREELLRIANFLNRELDGILLSDVYSHLGRKLDEAHDSLDALHRRAQVIALESFPRTEERRLQVEGSRFILEQPEFQNLEKSKRLFKAIETKESLLDLVQSHPACLGVQVQIGLEHHCDDIRDCSVVTAHYQIHERIIGTLGILGPKRMPYERIVSLVDYVARRFSETLEHWL